MGGSWNLVVPEEYGGLLGLAALTHRTIYEELRRLCCIAACLTFCFPPHFAGCNEEQKIIA